MSFEFLLVDNYTHVVSKTSLTVSFAIFNNLTCDILLSQNELKDDKYVYSSRPYTLLNDQLQHWNAEAERYKLLTDSLQVKLFCA